MTTLIPKYIQGATSTINRPINEKLGEMVSVKDFGAVGDGVTDDTAAIQAAVTYITRINVVATGSSTAINTGAYLVFPFGSYLISDTIAISSLRTLNIYGDNSILLGTGSVSVNLFTGTNLRNVHVKDLVIQNFNTVFAISTNNLDSSAWCFENIRSDAVVCFIDTLSYNASRSTHVVFRDCTWQYGVRQLAKIYCDSVTFYNCWFGSSEYANAYILANSNISFFSCMFVPTGAPIAGRCWVKFTNDNGAGGVTTDNARNIGFYTCRMGAESAGGGGAYVVADYPALTSTYVANAAIDFVNCYIGAYSSGSFETGNSESGIVYITQYPSSISFQGCSLQTVGPTTDCVVAKSDLLLTAPPAQFSITLDPASLKSALLYVSLVSTYTIALSLRGYVNNPEPSVFRDILEEGYLAIQDTTVTGKKMATFSLTGNYGAATWQQPITFMLLLTGQGDSSVGTNYTYGASSVYIVSLSGKLSGSAKSELTYTKLHGSLGGSAGDESADIVSLHFGTAETGITTSSPAVTYDVTVAFGTKIANGKARIVQSMLMPFGRYGQLPA